MLVRHTRLQLHAPGTFPPEYSVAYQPLASRGQDGHMGLALILTGLS